MTFFGFGKNLTNITFCRHYRLSPEVFESFKMYEILTKFFCHSFLLLCRQLRVSNKRTAFFFLFSSTNIRNSICDCVYFILFLAILRLRGRERCVNDLSQSTVVLQFTHGLYNAIGFTNVRSLSHRVHRVRSHCTQKLFVTLKQTQLNLFFVCFFFPSIWNSALMQTRCNKQSYYEIHYQQNHHS